MNGVRVRSAELRLDWDKGRNPTPNEMAGKEIAETSLEEITARLQALELGRSSHSEIAEVKRKPWVPEASPYFPSTRGNKGYEKLIAATTAGEGAGEHSSKLPTLELPKFEGENSTSVKSSQGG